MKTLIILFVIMILPSLGGVGGGLYAQIVNIPDPNFKARLIIAEVDTNNDGEIQVSEAEAVTGMLDVGLFHPDYPIYDLTGIEAFINITGLNVELNQLTTLDLSNNPLLTELYCNNNNLTYLNVENCVYLEKLICSQNQLISIDLTSNINLKEVSFYVNQLTYLDIRNGNNTNITEYFHSGNNPDLTCIFVDDAEYSENSSNWYKDPASTYVETQAECDALGIEDINDTNIRVYPNPVIDMLHLNFPDNHNYIELSILDIRGLYILNYKLHNLNNPLNLSELKSGVYFLIVKDNLNKMITTKKLIKL